MTELARRAVECKHWRWMPGMLVRYSARTRTTPTQQHGEDDRISDPASASRDGATDAAARRTGGRRAARPLRPHERQKELSGACSQVATGRTSALVQSLGKSRSLIKSPHNWEEVLPDLTDPASGAWSRWCGKLAAAWMLGRIRQRAGDRRAGEQRSESTRRRSGGCAMSDDIIYTSYTFSSS